MGLLSEGVLKYWCERRDATFVAPEFECDRFNDYVRTVTGGLIPQAISTIHGGTRLVLFSADNLSGEFYKHLLSFELPDYFAVKFLKPAYEY